MSAYADRRQARIDRMRARATKKHAEADARYAEADRIARVVDGQPVLIGHHSEKRARRDYQRITEGMRRGSEAFREAKELERRAEAAESNTAISSDDPDAIDALRRKQAALESERTRWNQIAKGLRKGTTEAIAALALTDDERRTIQLSGGHIGYKAKNLGAEIRRIAKRIAELEAAAVRPTREDETINGVTINESDNRVRLYFGGKPAEEIRAELKRNGFRWSPTAGAWQRQSSERAWHVAREICGKLAQP